MNKIDCNVIGDLLPLYVDKVCSKESAELVEEHIQSCEKCKKLFDEMNMGISGNIKAPDFESKAIFRNARKNLFGIIVAIALMISCFVINTGGAWEGGPAQIGHLVVTIIYLIFWGVFTVISRKYSPLVKMSFVISLLTFISSISGLVWRMFGQGGFVSAFISIFTSIPFYGLRSFMDWSMLYVAATVLSLCWLIYTILYMKKLKKHL